MGEKLMRGKMIHRRVWLCLLGGALAAVMVAAGVGAAEIAPTVDRVTAGGNVALWTADLGWG
ncbi:hypothetical protein GCM10010168_09470 [Actinoplanes ianthinogenes]|uniref:Uncharacterized protein n=1 Tax=Actinoplanes ianthinogenes TaxID=122358 RepID=A0ABM7LXS2_9ACTN|nr:hypothetical protein [Actinoplanes ianthinogenes]BCJ44134.1 hypothetical protein Aiant_47910 [Actinoplanes ianthinogenes]GGQ96007.1 hypothetical protein GCM10010168_09470 [Actinoplanes ianthinogenes]